MPEYNNAVGYFVDTIAPVNCPATAYAMDGVENIGWDVCRDSVLLDTKLVIASVRGPSRSHLPACPVRSSAVKPEILIVCYAYYINIWRWAASKG